MFQNLTTQLDQSLKSLCLGCKWAKNVDSALTHVVHLPLIYLHNLNYFFYHSNYALAILLLKISFFFILLFALSSTVILFFLLIGPFLIVTQIWGQWVAFLIYSFFLFWNRFWGHLVFSFPCLWWWLSGIFTILLLSSLPIQPCPVHNPKPIHFFFFATYVTQK